MSAIMIEEHFIDEDDHDDYRDEQVPDSLKEIFKNKPVFKDNNKHSLFTKTRGQDITTNTTNIEEVSLRKAEEVYKKLNIFNKIAVNAKEIPPLNNGKLLKKERLQKKSETTGKGWGDMPKVELTEEIKADLRAIKLRNFIYPKRFYKANDSNKLPKYF